MAALCVHKSERILSPVTLNYSVCSKAKTPDWLSQSQKYAYKCASQMCSMNKAVQSTLK